MIFHRAQQPQHTPRHANYRSPKSLVSTHTQSNTPCSCRTGLSDSGDASRGGSQNIGRLPPKTEFIRRERCNLQYRGSPRVKLLTIGRKVLCALGVCSRRRRRRRWRQAGGSRHTLVVVGGVDALADEGRIRRIGGRGTAGARDGAVHAIVAAALAGAAALACTFQG